MAKPKILENISTIQNSGFTNRAKQAEVTSYKELGNGRWFGELADAPESGVFFYNVFKGDNDNYKYVEAVSWINDKIFISKCINGEWSAWEDRKSVLESKINVLSGLVNGVKTYNTISELGLELGATFKEIGVAMKDNSRLTTYMKKQDYSECPTNYGILEVTRVNGNYISYLWRTSISNTSQNSQILYMAHYHTQSDLWTGWQQIATTDKTEILLLNGYEVVDSGRDELVVTRSGNICNITGRVINRTTAPNGIVVGVLDEQYRPKKYRRTFVHYEADSKTVSCEIKPNGDITIYDNTVAINKGFRFNITYCIEQ